MKERKGYYTIGVVSELFHVTPQTLRLYEEKGLISPSRSRGNKRLYDDNDLERLELVLRLTRELGINLAGVEVILNMSRRMTELQRRVEELEAELVKFRHEGF